MYYSGMSEIMSIKNNPAVSPVIGTILLVAITVVLVAVIAAVVVGLTTVPPAKVVGILAEEKCPDLQILVTGGQDSSSLQELRIAGDKGFKTLSRSLGNFTEGMPVLVPLSEIVSGPGLVTITGVFADGTEQMLWEGDVMGEGAGAPFTLYLDEEGEGIHIRDMHFNLQNEDDSLRLTVDGSKSSLVSIIEGGEDPLFKFMDGQIVPGRGYHSSVIVEEIDGTGESLVCTIYSGPGVIL